MPLLLSTLAATNNGSSALSLLFLPIMFVGAYFLLIRPQRRRLKNQNNLQSALAEGDEVITNSGMYGFITGFDGDIVWLEIDDNIQIRVARMAIQRKVDTSASSPTDAAPKGSGSHSSTTIDDIVEDNSDK